MFGVRPTPNAEREETSLTITAYDLDTLPELGQRQPPPSVGQCTGDGCDRKLVAQQLWEKADTPTRRAWRIMGYFRIENTTRCRLHAVRVGSADHNAQRAAEAERLARYVAGKYRGLVREGFQDPIGEIAHELNITVEYVQRLLRRAGQPYGRRDERKLRRDAIIEEVEFFRSIGRGLHEIATKVDMTEAQLSENLRHWRTQGLHRMDLSWLDTHDTVMVYRNQFTAA
jgi:hypothetical protein